MRSGRAVHENGAARKWAASRLEAWKEASRTPPEGSKERHMAPQGRVVGEGFVGIDMLVRPT